MSNLPPFTDSPGESAFYPAQPVETPTQQALMSSASNDPEVGSAHKLSALPENAMSSSPLRSIRSERSALPTSSSAPSLRSLLGARPFPASPENQDVKPRTVEGPGLNNSNQRVSFENSRASVSTSNQSPRAKVQIHPLLREVTHDAGGVDSMTGMSRSSDPVRPSSLARLAGSANSQKKLGHESPGNGTAPHSRATSPMRLFSWSAFHRTPEDPFVPVDPFRIRARLRRFSLHSPDIEHNLPLDSTCEENPFCCIPLLRPNTRDRLLFFLRDARYFLLDTLPRQAYLLFLLRLPSLYFSRIAKVYEDAQLSKPDLDRMIECYSNSGQQQQRERIIRSSPRPPGARYHPPPVLPFSDEWTATNASPALIRFKQSWEAFIDSLLREWKTLNLVSALLESAIMSMFQNQQMASDPVIRTAALLSMISALMSLSYGCIYIVRFGTMRSMHKATRWAEEAARTNTFILWNVWVLLAMPAVWLAWYVARLLDGPTLTNATLTAWISPISVFRCVQRNRSMIFFIAAILAFVWRYGSSTDPSTPPSLSPAAAIGPRVAISGLFVVGLLYFGAIVKTLHNYGRNVERGRFWMGNGTQDVQEDYVREGGQRGQGTSSGDGDRGRESGASQGRERTRRGREREATEPGGLSAVTGLGLTGLDEIASPHDSLVELPREKRRHAEANA